eukprot:882304-Pelagomonas_calceolata.AAC.3
MGTKRKVHRHEQFSLAAEQQQVTAHTCWIRRGMGDTQNAADRGPATPSSAPQNTFVKCSSKIPEGFQINPLIPLKALGFNPLKTSDFMFGFPSGAPEVLAVLNHK